MVSAAVMLISIWDLTLYLEAEKQFSQSEGFLDPLNAYHGNIATVWNGHLDNGELPQQANKQKQGGKKN